MRIRSWSVLAALILVTACNPSDRRPGLWLSGEPADYPADWSFAEAQKEIAVEVETPYLLPHSVTIWCATMDGDLFIGASAPETKNWPGWVDDQPDVRLLIDGRIYEVALVPVENPAVLRPLRARYASKYGLDLSAVPDDAPQPRYWQIGPRT